MRKPVTTKPETSPADASAPAPAAPTPPVAAPSLPEAPREGGSYFIDPEKGTVEKREGTIPLGNPDHPDSKPKEA